MKHSKELEELQKLHRSELEKFLKRKGYKMPASPLISTAPGNLSAGPILSPLNMTSIQSISSIPNPPPMPNPSLMSIQVPDNYPAIFSMAQRQPPSCKSASSFKDELFRCVESFTARSQANLLHSSGAAISQAGSRPFPAGVISHMSQTMTTDSEGRSRSPRVSSTCDVSRDNGSRRSSIDSEEVVTQSPIIHPNHPFIMQQPMYNFHYSDGSFMPAMAPGYSGAPFVEAGLPQPIRVTQYPPVSFLQPTSTQASSSATDVAPSGSQSQSKTWNQTRSKFRDGDSSYTLHVSFIQLGYSSIDLDSRDSLGLGFVAALSSLHHLEGRARHRERRQEAADFVIVTVWYMSPWHAKVMQLDNMRRTWCMVHL